MNRAVYESNRNARAIARLMSFCTRDRAGEWTAKDDTRFRPFHNLSIVKMRDEGKRGGKRVLHLSGDFDTVRINHAIRAFKFPVPTNRIFTHTQRNELPKVVDDLIIEDTSIVSLCQTYFGRETNRLGGEDRERITAEVERAMVDVLDPSEPLYYPFFYFLFFLTAGMTDLVERIYPSLDLLPSAVIYGHVTGNWHVIVP